jgi:hypothetical protein
MVIALFLLGWMPSGQGTAAEAPKPTVVVATQPPPPPVETGANAPLVCGASVLLIIIIGGVVWNVRLKKSSPEDH